MKQLEIPEESLKVVSIPQCPHSDGQEMKLQEPETDKDDSGFSFFMTEQTNTVFGYTSF